MKTSTAWKVVFGLFLFVASVLVAQGSGTNNPPSDHLWTTGTLTVAAGQSPSSVNIVFSHGGPSATVTSVLINGQPIPKEEFDVTRTGSSEELTVDLTNHSPPLASGDTVQVNGKSAHSKVSVSSATLQ